MAPEAPDRSEPVRTLALLFWAIIAGFLAFLISLGILLGITILIVRAIPPRVPNPTEAYEGFGDAMIAGHYFLVGSLLSLPVAASIGATVAVWVVHRANSTCSRTFAAQGRTGKRATSVPPRSIS
jgi:hypothetical protein